MNTDAAQVTNTDYIDPLASGFTITSSAPAELSFWWNIRLFSNRIGLSTMSEYRVRATGEVKSQGQIRNDNKNMSCLEYGLQTCVTRLGVDPVLAAPAPTLAVITSQ